MNLRRPFMIGEVGINHNGSLDTVKKLIDASVEADADAVKFQKRDVDLVYGEEYLESLRDSPWGRTQREQKEGLELSKKEYEEINAYCHRNDIYWFASAWDLNSLEFLEKFSLEFNKIASAMLGDLKFLEKVAKQGRYTFISTGMSTVKEIRNAVALFKRYDCPYELMHCNSTYPLPKDEVNLRVIDTLRDKFDCKVGYSGHEMDFIVSVGAVGRGATSIERHITLDRAMYGSDQAASIVPDTWRDLVSYCRTLYPALGDGVKRITESEKPIRAKLRSE